MKNLVLHLNVSAVQQSAVMSVLQYFAKVDPQRAHLVAHDILSGNYQI
jgi:hypothetical protein